MKFKDKMVEKAILSQLNGKVVEEGNKDSKIGFRFDVDGYVVRIFPKKGRKLCTCTCKNSVLFCNEPTLCHHKIAAIMEWIKWNRE